MTKNIYNTQRGPRLKVAHMSDNHNHYDFDVPKGDVLIHSGDYEYTRWVKSIEEFEIYRIENEKQFETFKEFVLDQLKRFGHFLFVPGNHDWLAYFYPEIFRKLEEETNGKFKMLIDEEIVIDGIKFYGTPYQPIFMDWAFNTSSRVLDLKYDRIPKDTDVLITHAPPHQILDAGINGQKVGSKELKTVLNSIGTKLKYNLFGHIHHSYGMYDTFIKYYNSAICNEEYEVENKPQVFEIEGRENE